MWRIYGGDEGNVRRRKGGRQRKIMSNKVYEN